MQAGKLRHRVTLQTEALTQNTATGDTLTATDVATLWAGVTSSGGREFYEAKRSNPELTHQVEIRYRSDIVAGMRFLFGSRVLRILAPIDPDGRRIRLLIMCEELVQ
jgi:SPP1 family predicted phage head-tail adaptor